jgi:acyl carrier protein
MESIGLNSLDARRDVMWAFELWDGSPGGIYAKINLDLFMAVNTIRGPWALLRNLQHSNIPQVSCNSDKSKLEFTAPSANVISTRLDVVKEHVQQPQLEQLLQIVGSLAAEILGAEQIDSDGAFQPGSLDSISAVELSNRISHAVGVDLPGTLVFDYPTVPALATFMNEKISGSASNMPVVQQLRSDGRTSIIEERPVLRLTVAERCPGFYRNSEGNFLAVLDAISMVPFSRWDLDAPKASVA